MIKISFIALIICICIINKTEAQITNSRIFPSSVAQIEPSIVKSPLNPLVMFASAYTISGAFRSEGVYVTTDGGLSWFGSDTCNSGASSNNHGGDPGPVIDKNGKFILTHQGGFITGMFSNTSSDLGDTWTANQLIASGDQEKGTPVTDDIASSSYYGRTYIVWTRYLNPFPIVVSYTTNSGTNWSAFDQINVTPAGYVSAGADVKVNYDGSVCVCWAGTITTSPQNEKFCGFARSVNGGVDWTVIENAYNMNGSKTSSLSPWNIRINGYPHLDMDKTGGARNGYIYIVTGELNLSPAGTDPDVVFHRSTDNGNTWSTGVRVNQDPINNGKVQYFPTIAVDDNGGINVIYYDNRNTLVADSMDVYLSRSTDGGNTWNDHRINQHRFRPKTVSGSGGAGNQGDNMGMVFANNKLWALWMDDHTGVYQIWSAAIDVNTIGIRQINSEIPAGFELKQNYPNPFNPATVIGYQLTVNSFINLKVFDATGKEIITLVNEKQNAGIYEVDFNGENLPSGVYFYKLESGVNSITKKMFLLK
ncbi:MAG TPA: T9SS type A sorting domain-containing protein [Ignavibacteria bacterium]|nr:T9SS type A sorting domain-containing protein [Ignavibacteria bacterium]